MVLASGGDWIDNSSLVSHLTTSINIKFAIGGSRVNCNGAYHSCSNT